MDNKFLNSDSTSISYEELVAYTEDLIKSEEFETLKKVYQNHRFVLFKDENRLKTSLQIFYKILNGLSKSVKDFSAVSPYFINLSGLFCAKLNLRKESLYLYLLALLSSGEKMEIALYYNNVGSALANLDDFKLANTFYDKALVFMDSYLERNEKDATIFQNLTLLNHAISCIRSGNYETAVRNYKEVNTDDLNHVDHLYFLVKHYIKLHELKDDYASAINLLKSTDDKYKKQNISLRIYIIENYNISPLDRYNLLKENLDQLLHEPTMHRKRIGCLTQLIVHAQVLNKKEEEFNFLKLLFEENLNQNSYESIASKIIVEQYIEFFNKLTQINTQIKNQKDELQKLTYILSHNLKTPIRSVYGFSQLLANRHASSLDPEANEFLDFIDKGCKELYELLNNILHITDYNEKIEPESVVSLSQILEQIEREFSVSSEKDVEIIKQNELPNIWARKSDIKELFEILIENGVKFNNSQVPVIRFEYILEKEKFNLIVSDNGIGIDSFGKKKIFGLFTKLEDKSQYTGTGFGLGMAKKILERYNGNILLKETGDNGSVFSIELPQNLIVERKV